MAENDYDDSSSTSELQESNVRMVLDDDFLPSIVDSMTENSWEILNVSNMNTFVFPGDNSSPGTTEEPNLNTYCPKNVDIALVFQTIEQANGLNPSDDEYCPSFLKLKDYNGGSDSSKGGIKDRPCGFLTPRNSIMPMIIIPTKNYTHNGLVFSDEINNPKKGVSVPASSDNCFNWIVTKKSDENPNQFTEYKNYGNVVITQEGFSFINTSSAMSSKEKNGNSNPATKKSDGKTITRKYVLNDKIDEGKDFYYQPDKSEDIEDDSLIFIAGDTNENYKNGGGAFAFAYDFHDSQTNNQEDDDNSSEKPAIQLEFSAYTSSNSSTSTGESKTSKMYINIPQNGNIEVNLFGEKTSGSVTPSKNSQKMGQLLEKTFSDGTMIVCYPAWNGWAISGGIDDKSKLKDSAGTINVTVDNGFFAVLNNDASMADFCDPHFSEYDTKLGEEITVINNNNNPDRTTDTNLSVIYDHILSLQTKNCFVSFAYTPVFFQRNMKFSVYIKDSFGNDIIDGADNSTPTRTHYLYPIYYKNNYSVADGEVKGKVMKVDTNTEGEQETYYRFDFSFDATRYQRRGMELFGFFHRVVGKNRKREMNNYNGRINIGRDGVYNDGFVERFNKRFQGVYENPLKNPSSFHEDRDFAGSYNTDWIKYATEISVNRSSTQTGGTISLDKYAMIGQIQHPYQPIGEVRLKAIGGKVKKNNTNDSSASSDEYIKTYVNEENVYFTGLGIGLSYQDGESSDIMTLNLSGIEQKLQDIKLAGSPYFDGDPISDVMDYLSQYGNFQYEFNSNINIYEKDGTTGEYSIETQTVTVEPGWMAGGVAPCPRSVEFQRPAINFILGTTVWEAIQQVCQKTNKTPFITKEGIVRIIDNNVYGVPMNIAQSLSNGKPSFVIYSDQILNINLQPYTDNVYNQVITASLKGKRKGGEFPSLQLNEKDMIPNIMYDRLEEGNFVYPWSRMIVNNEIAILSKKELERVHAINKSQFLHATFTGGITIPGNSLLEIFDTIQISDDTSQSSEDTSQSSDDTSKMFYITGINHNYNSATRVWTTSLQVTYLDNEFTDFEGWLKTTLFDTN